MPYPNPIPPVCPVHGRPVKRATCAGCNSAFMRGYLRRRRLDAPGLTMWNRARKRAKRHGLAFDLPREDIPIPERCPVLDIPLEVGPARAYGSPSLDRIVPTKGYVPGNTRVVSDQANRLKGNLTLGQLRKLAATGPLARRDQYARVANYVDREGLLAEVRSKAALGGRVGVEWQKIADFLDLKFRCGPVLEAANDA